MICFNVKLWRCLNTASQTEDISGPALQDLALNPGLTWAAL